MEAKVPKRLGDPLGYHRPHGRNAYWEEISRQNTQGGLLGRGVQKKVRILHQRFGYQTSNSYRPLQEPLADRAVLQMAQTASQDKKVLGRNRERRSNPNIFRDNSLLHDGHRPEKAGGRTFNLRDAPNRKYLIDRYYRSENLVRLI